MIDYYLGDVDVFLAGIVPNYPGKETHPNDFPYEVAFQAALSLLYGWVRDGRRPFTAEPVRVDEHLVNLVAVSYTHLLMALVDLVFDGLVGSKLVVDGHGVDVEM